LVEFVEFFETHDMGEYWDSMPEAHFDVEMVRFANSAPSVRLHCTRGVEQPPTGGDS
jgi:hypothetical protein